MFPSQPPETTPAASERIFFPQLLSFPNLLALKKETTRKLVHLSSPQVQIKSTVPWILTPTSHTCPPPCPLHQPRWFLVVNGYGGVVIVVANSSTQADEDRPKKRYMSDDSIATMLGDKLDNFTAVFKADVSEAPPKPASPEVIWAALAEIPDLEDDDWLAIYDVLVADDRKFKSLMTLPQKMKKKWVLKQIKI